MNQPTLNFCNTGNDCPSVCTKCGYTRYGSSCLTCWTGINGISRKSCICSGCINLTGRNLECFSCGGVKFAIESQNHA